MLTSATAPSIDPSSPPAVVSSRRRPSSGFAAAALLTVCAVAAAPAYAEDIDVLLRHSFSSGDYERAGVGMRFKPLWSDDWGNWKATVRPEVEVSHFRYSGSKPGRSSLNQLGAIAQFRLTYGSSKVRPYVEAGLGGSLFSHTSLGDKAFSTAFQFSEHVGAGIEFAERWYVGWQFSHYSNAGIKRPNNGLDLHQIMLGMRF